MRLGCNGMSWIGFILYLCIMDINVTRLPGIVFEMTFNVSYSALEINPNKQVG